MNDKCDFPITVWKDNSAFRIDEDDFKFWFRCAKLLDEIKETRLREYYFRNDKE